jgi:hypothetical protein
MTESLHQAQIKHLFSIVMRTKAGFASSIIFGSIVRSECFYALIREHSIM